MGDGNPVAPRHRSASDPILPGATLGVVGGGQLGRMFAQAAARMGYDVAVLCEDADQPAAQVTRQVVVGSLDDERVVDDFARRCAVITLEFENIPAATIARCARHAPTYPSASVLAIAQDRWREKSTLEAAGLPVTPFRKVDDADSLRDAAGSLGWPIIVKTNRSGYDGKGQYRVESSQDADSVPWNSADGWVAEQLVLFEREVSVIVARTASGRTSTFPPLENQHRNHILDVSRTPAAIPESLARRAEQIAIGAAETLDVVGLLCVEMFVRDEEVCINEVAPRPHNSGHLTIEACRTSQFEQQVRAICDLPLGSTESLCSGAAMVNLLGDLWPAGGGVPNWAAALRFPGVNLHLYGKRDAKPGRKMGHLTAVSHEPEEAARRLLQAREAVRSGQAAGGGGTSSAQEAAEGCEVRW